MKAPLALGLTDSDRAAQVIALAEEAGEIEVVATPQTSDDVITVLAHTEVEVLVLDEELGPLPVLRARAPRPAGQASRVGCSLLAAQRGVALDLLRQAVRRLPRRPVGPPPDGGGAGRRDRPRATWAQAVRERSEADDLARVADTSAAR